MSMTGLRNHEAMQRLAAVRHRLRVHGDGLDVRALPSYGFGHRSPRQRRAHGQGADAAQLLTRYVTDPLMGGTSLHSNFVTFGAEA